MEEIPVSAKQVVFIDFKQRGVRKLVWLETRSERQDFMTRFMDELQVRKGSAASWVVCDNQDCIIGTSEVTLAQAVERYDKFLTVEMAGPKFLFPGHPQECFRDLVNQEKVGPGIFVDVLEDYIQMGASFSAESVAAIFNKIEDKFSADQSVRIRQACSAGIASKKSAQESAPFVLIEDLLKTRLGSETLSADSSAV